MSALARPGPAALLLTAVALPLAVGALALLIGAGVVRGGPPGAVVLASGALVLLPALGLASPWLARAPALPAGLGVWSVCVVLGFPLFFPAERAQAGAVGLNLLLAPLGVHLEPSIAQRMDRALPTPADARVPPPAAVLLADQVQPPRTSGLADEDVVLPYEGDGRTLSIPVAFEGPGVDDALEVWMLYDTGATLTTLDAATLRRLGVRVPADAPTLTVRTANGERETSLVLLDRVWIGGMPVEGVTVSVCESCAGDDTVGLLGLNVSGRFQVTVDTSRKELVLRPHPGEPDRMVDVSPWLAVRATATRWEDGRVEVEVGIDNDSARTVESAQVAIYCDKAFKTELTDIRPGATASEVVALPVGSDCEGYSVKLVGAAW